MLLILGPKQPDSKINVYLELLIDELKKFWVKSIIAFNTYHQKEFNLRKVQLWAINDFSIYGILTCHVVKGYYAYSICSENTYG